MSIRKFSLLIIVVSLSLCIFGCGIFEDEEKPKPKPEPTPEPVAPESVSSYKFSGGVVNENAQPISNVKIIYMGNGLSGTIFSDINGKFTVTGISVGSYTLTALKTGYTYGEVKFAVTENGASVPDILLSNIREIEGREEKETTAAEIKEQGTDIVSVVEEEVSTGGFATEMKQKEVKASIQKETEITIAGEKVTEEIVLSAAPLQVDEIPPPEKEDEMPFGAAVFEPQGATFSQPVEISVPLEIQLPAGLEIPLKKYEDGQWKDMGTATIDESGLGADADVTEFGQFAIQPKVTVEVEPDPEPKEEVVSSVDVPAEQETFSAEVTDSVEFPGGLPEGVTVEYAISLIEKMKGTKIGVTKSVTVESPLVKTAAKIAKAEETWIIKWTVTKIETKETETITLTIDLGGGQQIDFDIIYEYIKEGWEPVIDEKTVKWWIDVTVNGVNGATVDVSGDSAQLQDGVSHRFYGLTGENYTLTPSKTGWKFTPSSATITKLGNDVSYSFTAQKIKEKITISGTVTGADDVTVTLSGDATDMSGIGKSGQSYTFAVDANKNYTVTPSKDGYTFDPSSATFSSLSSDTSQDFTAKQATATISGTVSGANGVKVTLSGAKSDSKDLTNAGDSYSFSVPVGGDYTVSATKGSFIVTPESQTFTNLTSDATVDFIAKKKQKRVYIAGSVVGANNVTVSLTGDASKSATLSDGGSYSWEVKAGGNYTISASATGVDFVQSSETYSNLQVDAGLIFEAIKNVTISGSLTLEDGSSISGVTVSLSGDAQESQTVDGSYSFTVKAGGQYSVSPSKTGVSFSPSELSNTVVTNDITQDFVGEVWITISGTVTGADGVTVTLSGTLAGSQIVGDGESYSFNVKAGGTYGVSASKSDFTFDPPSSTFSNLNSDATQDFAVIGHSQGTVQ